MTAAFTPLALLLMAGAGAAASAVNAFAGGGSLISFPALIGLGLASIPANATNSVALWPGNVASAVAFLPYIQKVKQRLALLLSITLAGSLAGSFLLLITPANAFKVLVPVLILVATLLLAFQKAIRSKTEAGAWKASRSTGALLQFGVSIYGGYFGAGMGIMMLAVLSLFVEGEMNELNALKNWLTVAVNLGSTVVFVSKGIVQPIPALTMMAGALFGGFAGAKFSQKVPGDLLRKAIVAYGFVMTGWFIWSLRG